MSDEDRQEEGKESHAEEEESDHAYLQRLASPELRWLDLFERLTARVEKTEERVKTNEEESKRGAEETQRNMDFIVQQQAQFSVGMQKLEERQAQFSADLQRLREVQALSEQKWERTAQGITALLAIAEMHEREIFELRQTQVEEQARTDARMVETGERLNALINTVERIISERRNGGRKEESQE